MRDETTDTIQLIGAKVTFVPIDEGTSYSLTEWDVEPGTQGPPVHIHHEHDEGFYVMTGHFGFVLDGITTYDIEVVGQAVPSPPQGERVRERGAEEER